MNRVCRRILLKKDHLQIERQRKWALVIWQCNPNRLVMSPYQMYVQIKLSLFFQYIHYIH
jgi:hypothetical protein